MMRMGSRYPLLLSGLILAACNSGDAPSESGEENGAAGKATAIVAAPQTEAAPAPAELDREGALRAAGYEKRAGVWMASCEADVKPVPKDSWHGLERAEFEDLNGDGSPEATITGGSSYCFGNTGLSFKLLTKSGNGWKLMEEGIGIPAFYTRKGLAWPDIEIGGPGADCFGFLRWNGSEYVHGGRSLAGRICELAPAFDPKAAKAMKAGVPMAPGLWAKDPEACAAVKRGERDPDFIYDGKAMLAPQDALTLSPIKRLANGFYQTGKEYERQIIQVEDPEFIVVRESVLWKGNYFRCSSSTRWQAWEP